MSSQFYCTPEHKMQALVHTFCYLSNPICKQKLPDQRGSIPFDFVGPAAAIRYVPDMKKATLNDLPVNVLFWDGFCGNCAPL